METVLKCFSVDFIVFNIFGNLRKSSEIFGNHRKISDRHRKCLYLIAGVEKFRSWFLRSHQKDPSKLLRASNDGKEEWNTTRCIPQNMQRQS